MSGRERLLGIVERLAETLRQPATVAESGEALEPIPVMPAPLPRVDHSILGAQTLEQAKGLYDDTRENDPFPEVAPALLNSAHIEDYMLATAMVYPYQRERRKSASYAMRVGRELAFWDPDRPERELPIRPLGEREKFVLPPNSLVYVQTKELFQLPNYIAVRFNLHIDLVHKGLLLGTGPLVDPGFRGQLMIPLHNMTANTYVLAEDDELIWAEFTKTSLKPEWIARAKADPTSPQPSADFADFPTDKSNKKMSDYFGRALAPHELTSGARLYPFPANAIPKAVRDAERTAERAKENAEVARGAAKRAAGEAAKIRNWGILTIIAVGIGLVALIWATLQMVQATAALTDSTAEKVRTVSNELGALHRQLAIRDADGARNALADFCALPASAAARADRLRLSTRVAEAEKAASRSASAAGLPEPVHEPLRPTAEPQPGACSLP